MFKVTMIFKRTVQFFTIIILSVAMHSCIETFEDFKTETFESALVIEATITNELKKQEILLSRTFALEEDGPSPERNADVKVIDDVQNEYIFQETDSGRYVSTMAFNAKPNRTYSLSIKTNDGRSYTSDQSQLTQATQIDNLYAVREFNRDSIEGVSIFVDSFDPTGNSKFYRYEYEETYKIVAPKYIPFEVVFHEGSFTEFDLLPRPEQEKICYNTIASNTIIISNTTELNEDRIDRFPVRFLNRNNYIISHRYSILVRQFVQSREAYVYYEALKSFSELENLFSENQPGFINGNVFSENNRDEKVIGFFEVSSVDSKRIYFNYIDLFPDEELPLYAINCGTFIAPQVEVAAFIYPLFDHISSGFQYVSVNPSYTGSIHDSPFFLVHRACGDCTALGKTEIPDFWIE